MTVQAVPVPPPSWREAHAIFSAWIRREHVGARRRAGVSFRAAADMHDLWQRILRIETTDG